MNPQQPYPDQPATLSKPNPLEVDQPGEQTVCEIKRHPIGIVGNYVSAALGFVAVAVVGYFLIHQFVDADSRSHIMLLFAVGVAGLGILEVLFLLITSSIYWNNRWVVTTDSLTQIQQIGLFRKQVSQLSMANLEDVTAVQSGLLQSMFNFGTLRVETAGERSKFMFPYCPNPTSYARQILACRESFIRNDPDVAKRANDELDTPAPVPPAPAYSPPVAPPLTQPPAGESDQPLPPASPTQPSPFR